MRHVVMVMAVCLTAACGGSSGGSGGRELAQSLGFGADVRSVCGDPRILGVPIGDVAGPGACGIENAVRLHAVGDVVLSPTARVNCNAARAFRAWVEGAAQPAAREVGTRLTQMRVAASYACRTRNSRRGAKISEHAKGNAIDISNFRFSNGDKVEVLTGWRGGAYSGFLRKVHGAACGPFGTVLGPNADRFHQDHFHFDVARYGRGRGRTYCR